MDEPAQAGAWRPSHASIARWSACLGHRHPAAGPGRHVQAVTLQRARRQVWPMCGVSSRDRSGPQRRMVRCWDSRQPLLGWVLSAQNSPHHRAAAVHRRCALIARGLGYGGIDIGFISPPAEPAGGGPSASAGRLDPTALRSLAHDRDLVVLAWGNAIDVHCGAAAARLLQQELARHCGSLAVLGWTTDAGRWTSTARAGRRR